MPAHRSVTLEQFNALLEIMNSDTELATGVTYKSTFGRELRQSKWEKVAARLNALNGCKRTPILWRKYWNEQRYLVRKKARQAKSCESEKSHIKGSKIRLTEEDKRILAALGDDTYVEECNFPIPSEESNDSSSSPQEKTAPMKKSVVVQKLPPVSPKLSKPPKDPPPLQPARQLPRYKIISSPQAQKLFKTKGMPFRVFAESIRNDMPSKPPGEDQPMKQYEDETQWAMKLEERKLTIEMEKAKSLREIASALSSTRQDITNALSELQSSVIGLKHEMTSLKHTIEARMPYFEVHDQS